mmetsp:Transcript_10161/g.25486  ORF Transcript_10161/g.25486 Transcript_10161/m.25486 type:complete len:121 (-) Transcript_10161:131-493(-)
MLEKFDSYKLWSASKLTFASNALRSIRLHRAESLRELELWAPRLEKLDLQAVWDLDRIEFVENPALRAQLEEGFTFTAPLRVSVINGKIGANARRNLLEHPSVRKIEGDKYGDDGDFEGL